MTGWTVDAVEAALAELAALPPDMRAKFDRIVVMIEGHGLHAMREPYVKHLEDKLWEMRMTGRDGIARAIYFTASGKRVMVARVFAKKTQKTPRAEIEMALRRMKEWNDGQG
jgi:phage-related protein